MIIKVKSLVGKTSTAEIEVPRDARIGELKEVVITQLRPRHPWMSEETISFSFNDEFLADDNATFEEYDINDGDLLEMHPIGIVEGGIRTEH